MRYEISRVVLEKEYHHFKCSIVSHASQELHGMLLKFWWGNEPAVPISTWLTDHTCWNGCKMMRTWVWTVYFVDPWPPFSWNVPENESIRTNPKIWPAAYHFLSEQPLKSLALVQHFLVMPVTHVIKDEDLSGSEKEAGLMIIVLLAWCFMFPSNHMLFL